MLVYAFIFARGGSKGLPKKNIRPLAGKPLINYSIECALNNKLIDHVFVSTDCTEIAHIAKLAGAIIIDRPSHLAEDNSPEWLAWQHAVVWVKEHYGQFDIFVSLPATSPLRNDEDINKAIDILNDGTVDTCISVTPSNRNPYFNMVTINPLGYIGLVNANENTVSRRQDAPVVYDITTVVYATRPQFIMSNERLLAGKTKCITIPKERAVDIDDIYDFIFAETMLAMQGELNAK